MRSVRPRLWVALAALVAGAIMVGDVAGAGADHAPKTEPLSGAYTLRAVSVTARPCVGTDGTYIAARGGLVGTSTSSDPRFNGRFDVFIERGFINLTTGYGTSRGHVTWRDASGTRTAEAAYHEVITHAGHEAGIFVGRVAAADGLPAGELFANYTASFDAQLNATGEFGGTSDSQTPAVVQTGRCSDDEQGDEDGDRGRGRKR